MALGDPTNGDPLGGESALEQDGWYEIVDGPELEQGDLLVNLATPRVFLDPAARGGARISVGRGDYIVLSQTCDLEHGKVPEVLLASVRAYQEVAHEHQRARSTAFRDALIQGTDVAYFLLHEFAGTPALDWSLVNFHQLRLVDKRSCEDHARGVGKRLRLVPPYKENLAQSYAKYMMRVALPRTAHSFKEIKYVLPAG